MGANTSHSDVRVVLDSLRRIVSALRVFDRETEKRLGLSAAQAFVLEKLKDAGGISVNELADRTHTHQSSVSVVVRKLVSRGLVKRSSSDRDGRQVVLELSKKGRELQRSAPAAAQERLISALQAMPGPRRRTLGRLLVELIQKTGIHRERPGLFFESHNSRRAPTPAVPSSSLSLRAEGRRTPRRRSGQARSEDNKRSVRRYD